MNTLFPTNKADIYKTLDFFIKNFLQKYASKRNFDLGPPHTNVSKLSPFIRRRYLSEKEILETILSKYSLNSVSTSVIDKKYKRITGPKPYNVPGIFLNNIATLKITL